MSPDDYRSQYECNFQNLPPPLLDLTMEYHRRCEAYDRTVCSGGIGPEGAVMPGDYRETGLITRNSQMILSELAQRSVERGSDRQELLHTIREYDEHGNSRR